MPEVRGLKNYLAVLLMLTLLLLLAACVNNEINTPPPEQQPAIEAETPPEFQSPKTETLKVDKTPALPAKIAIITNDVTQNEEEFRSAQELISMLSFTFPRLPTGFRPSFRHN